MNVWDGTGMAVMTGSGIKHVTDLHGATICVRPGTTTELDLADWARRKQISYNPVSIGGLNESEEAFLSGRCDALTTDTLQLAGFRFSLGPRAAGLTILPEQLATRPSGSMVRKGDDRWVEIVPYVHYAQVEAESLGVTQANVDSFGVSAD